MNKVRLTFLLCALNGVVLPAAIAAPLPKAEFNWRAAPSEEQIATLTLRDAILRAFARNPKISQAAAQIHVGEGDLDAAKSAWYPQISLQGAAGRSHQTDSAGSLNNNGSGGIMLSQLLYDFGRTGGAIDEQHALSEAYLFGLFDSMTTVAEDTLQAYLEVKRYQALAETAHTNIASLERVRDIARLRADAGLNSQSDVLQAETRIAAMHATLEQYRAQLRSAKAQLTVLTGVVPAALPELPQALLNQQITLDKIAYANSAAVRSAQAKQEAARERVRQAQSGHWPTIKVQAGRTRYENDRQSYWDDEVQLQVEAPLYQGGMVNAKTQSAEGDREAAQAAVQQAKLTINQNASTAYADMIGAQQRQAAGEVQLESADHTRNVYADEYRLSKRSLNDLLSVEQDVFQADSSRITALYDGWDATVRYAAAVDNLLDILGIDRQRSSGDLLPSLQ
ncbi:MULTISPECIES: TolC family outer membrane protein [Pantoea]|jgi:adhesin transport system outer membrane protein|uniref:TolC family outer membrane protein n=1 Tax=Pantoea brenneri TaxID=472694 RepID=A0A7Y6NEB2_9GAMM|nr:MULTISPECIES: TolC family outer membrane protein [Pantoea]MBZ6395093.1 TolC family outer membrane protein [Pantoea sp.]MBZ6438032.1 TolC family outer membrane protein [Pantoea sp.]MDH1086916.1 TolC family outer membrane protein [Pantoea brenneri]MDU4126648.1 TolC family outer membrane protein [Pantoea sp.]NUY42004.1 TolC family outer membrane protein [Pantoea brenneri]